MTTFFDFGDGPVSANQSSTAHVVSVSGGKDSTALLLLAIESGVDPIAVFADTGHEHPLTYDYIRYLEEAVGKPIRWVRADFSRQIAAKREYIKAHWLNKGVSAERIERALAALQPTGNPFLDLCLWKGRFPSAKARFCTEELKVLPITEQVMLPLLKTKREVWSWQGVRADESRARSVLTESEPLDVGVIAYRPLLRWSVDEVFAMHRKHSIQPNPLYAKGMGRVGCMPCIHCRKDELREIALRFPEELERVREWERMVSEASKRGSSTFFAASNIGILDNDETTQERANVHVFAEWSKTSRGGVQYDLLKQSDPAACSSLYGLCE